LVVINYFSSDELLVLIPSLRLPLTYAVWQLTLMLLSCDLEFIHGVSCFLLHSG